MISADLRRFGRPGLVTVVMLSIVLGVTACDQIEQDRFAIRADGEALLIAVCEPFRSDAINIEERASAGEWIELWVEDAAMPLSSGSVLSIGPTDFPSAFSKAEVVPDLSPGNTISILLSSRGSAQESSLTSSITIGEQGLSEDQWLSSDKSVKEEPCA